RRGRGPQPGAAAVCRGEAVAAGRGRAAAPAEPGGQSELRLRLGRATERGLPAGAAAVARIGGFEIRGALGRMTNVGPSEPRTERTRGVSGESSAAYSASTLRARLGGQALDRYRGR